MTHISKMKQIRKPKSISLIAYKHQISSYTKVTIRKLQCSHQTFSISCFIAIAASKQLVKSNMLYEPYILYRHSLEYTKDNFPERIVSALSFHHQNNIVIILKNINKIRI